MLQPSRLSRNTLISLAGLLVGIAGLIIQWIAEPSKFDEPVPPFGVAFPPGIGFVVAAGLLVLLTARWWWHTVFGVFIAFWIAGVGTLAGQLTPNLTSDNVGTVAGNVIMAGGLIVTFIVGIRGMIAEWRIRRAVRSTRDRVHQP